MQSAGGFPLGLARRSREKHALMNDTQDLDDAVRRDAIDQQMAGAAHPLSWRHQTPRRSEMVGADTRNPRDFARACCPGVVTHDGQRSEYQSVITPCSLDTPLARAFEEDGIDPFLGSSDETKRHYPRSAASRSRKRAMVSL